MTYINTSLFVLPLFTIVLGRTWRLWRANKLSQVRTFAGLLQHLDADGSSAETQSILRHDAEGRNSDDEPGDPEAWNAARMRSALHDEGQSKLGLKATAKLSFEFCLLWVSKNSPNLREIAFVVEYANWAVM